MQPSRRRLRRSYATGLALLCTGPLCLFCPTPVAAQEDPAPPPPPAALPEQCQHGRPATWDEQLAASPVAVDTAQLHRHATGSGVTVAVIDTGVSRHPRLHNYSQAIDLIPGTPGAADLDCDGHGTVVAGIIAAADANDGLVGVAPDATIISIRQTSAFGEHEDPQSPTGRSPGAGNLAGMAAAITAATEAGARVINISVVSCLNPAAAEQVDLEPLRRAVAAAEDAGAVIVAAAGNAGQQCTPGDVVLPAHLPTVVAVGALADHYSMADFSVPVPADHRLISAPGAVAVGLNSHPTAGGGLIGAFTGRNGDVPLQGTSFAAPVVAGIAALLAQRYPTASAAQIRQMLYAVSDPSTGGFSVAAAVNQLPPAGRAHTAAVFAPRPPEEKSPVAARVAALWGLVAGTAMVLVLIRAAWRRRRFARS